MLRVPALLRAEAGFENIVGDGDRSKAERIEWIIRRGYWRLSCQVWWTGAVGGHLLDIHRSGAAVRVGVLKPMQNALSTSK